MELERWLCGLRVYCFVEDVSSVPSTHIKRFTTPDPRALTPLAPRGTCAHGHVPPDTDTCTCLKIIKINLQNKCTNRGFTHSLYNMGATDSSSLGWEAFTVHFKRCTAGSWRDGSGVESIGCSHRRPRFISIHRTLFNSSSGNPAPSSDLRWHQPGKHVYRYNTTLMHINLKDLVIFSILGSKTLDVAV